MKFPLYFENYSFIVCLLLGFHFHWSSGSSFQIVGYRCAVEILQKFPAEDSRDHDFCVMQES